MWAFTSVSAIVLETICFCEYAAHFIGLCETKEGLACAMAAWLCCCMYITCGGKVVTVNINRTVARGFIQSSLVG